MPDARCLMPGTLFNTTNMIRKPVVAGQFYTANAARLEKEIKSYLEPEAKKIDAIGCVSPHAGYMYSGPVAGSVLSHIKPKNCYIILGPNHTGKGDRFGMGMDKNWMTPLGEVEIDNELAQAILDNSKLIKKDDACHMYEHSIEVQLPILQVLNRNFSFVPIVISQGTASEYIRIGEDIAEAIQKTKRNLTIIASSDMTHYESQLSAKKKDMLAIERIKALDIEGLIDTIEKYDISMCGYAPTAAMMSSAIKLGAKNTELIKYQTSGDTSGDYSSVVGYAGIIIY